jgi:hypothetical protein
MNHRGAIWQRIRSHRPVDAASRGRCGTRSGHFAPR